MWHRLDVASRYAAPGMQTAVVLLFLSAPLGLPGQAQLQPAWALTSVFFWSLYRPNSMPAPLVFAIGLLLDLLAQGPVGIHVLILLFVHGCALRYRRTLTRSGFALVWVAFTGLAAASALAEWLLVALLTWSPVPPWPGLFEWGVATGCYPLAALYLITLHRGRAAPEQAS